MGSLQSRLGIGLLLSLIVAVSALWIVISLNVRQLAEDYIASRLQHDAQTLLAALSFDENHQPVLDSERIDQIYRQPFSGHYYVISSNGEQLYSRSLWDQDLQFSTVASGEQQRHVQTGPESQLLLVLSSGYTRERQNIVIAIAEDLNPIIENIDLLLRNFTLIAGGILLLLVLLQALILRYSLRPLNRIQAELKSLEKGEQDQLDTDVPRELRPLIDEVNHLLTVMTQRLRRSRDALGDLAHAIKKPLTVIQHSIDRDDMPETTRNNLAQQTRDIYQLSDRILKRARLAGHSHSGQHFSFNDDLPALIRTLDIMYLDKRVQLATQLPQDSSCPLDREDLMELLGNLLDNAYKWANKNVALTISMDDRLQIMIEDDGPGAEKEQLQALAARGVRLDEATEGHGFGLAIAADIIADYNGEYRLGRSNNLGGFRAEVILPLRTR